MSNAIQSYEIFIGVLSGVLTSAFIYVTNGFLKNTLIPLFRSAVYKSTELSGTWYIEREDVAADGKPINVKTELIVNFRQKADELTGTATSKRPDDNSVTHFDVVGTIRDRFVLISFYIKDRKRIAYQGFMLEVIGDGQVMSGYNNFYGLLMKEVRSVKCSFKRHNTY